MERRGWVAAGAVSPRAWIGVVDAVAASFIAVATEAGSDELVVAGFPSGVALLGAWVATASALDLSLVPLGSAVVVPLVSSVPQEAPLLSVEEVKPASSRVACLGTGEWILSFIPPELAIVSRTLPGEITDGRGDWERVRGGVFATSE